MIRSFLKILLVMCLLGVCYFVLANKIWERRTDQYIDLRMGCRCGNKLRIEHDLYEEWWVKGWVRYTCLECGLKYRISRYK